MADEADKMLGELDGPKKRVLESLEMHHGIVTPACEGAQVPRSTFYYWMSNDPVFKQAVEAVQDVAIDFVESKLFQQIENRDTTAMIFYLKCKGKKRGYIERVEQHQVDGEGNTLPPPVINVYSNKPKDYETK